MKKWLLSLAAVMALAGCADNTAGVRVDSQTQNVFFGDKVLGSRLQVEDIRTDLVDGHTRGIVRLNSNYKGDQHILYRFYWYDDAGLEVNLKQGPWKQAIVRGFESISLSEVSVNSKATQFRVQFREQ
ncbi:YcfL family protein [Vibrio atlanticus]|uniref:YcfL family protein n=1 Tax=Vibrio atlanticus TaxID=693153 RepID=UPI0022AF8432|nr:YcfL family protein [Vibrio atlanticus]MCZ4309352.1 YcfL family protein [Vibrio atlanticus]